MTTSTLAIHGGSPVRPKDRFLVFGSPMIEEPEIQEIVACLRSGWIGTGPRVARFEQDFAAFKDCKHAVAVSSCTAALHLSMIALDIGPGDEVITTSMTFCATVNAIIHAGATPVLVDCERDSMNISPSAIEASITDKTKAIVPVHFAGRPCDMDAICAIAQKHNLRIIEDCAHAIESDYHGKPTGTFGDVGCFSFYVTKNIITGEGGMVTTNDDEIASRIKIAALHGMSKDAWKRFSDEGYKHYQVVSIGFKNNMTDLQAALGIHQLTRIEPYWQRRRQIWQRYQQAFADSPVFLPQEAQFQTRHAHHLYTVLVDIDRLKVSRDQILTALTAEGIGVGVHYLPVHTHPFYQQTFAWKNGQFPNAEWIGDRTLSLPLSVKMSDQDAEDVIVAVRKVLSGL
jgi:dTDP-4-amino-4,6-dideoxygalactose transaminase